MCGMSEDPAAANAQLQEGQRQLEALGLPTWLAKKALLAYPHDLSRAADFAFESAPRRKSTCVREAVSPRCLNEVLDLTGDGGLTRRPLFNDGVIL